MTPASPWLGRAPGRVNLIGEHVDYAGGRVLPCAIDRFVTARGDRAERWSMESEIEGGTPYLTALGHELGVGPQRVQVTANLPAGAGLASSAALLVALARGLAPGLEGARAALIGQRAEQRATGVMVGAMDHFASALGRRGHAMLLDCSTFEYRQVPLPEGIAIAIVDSGLRRQVSSSEYGLRRQEVLSGDARRVRHVESENARVTAFVAAMESGDLKAMGELLGLSHASLRDDFEVSRPELDQIVTRATASAGCLGARLIGAGFGGSVLALLEAGAEARFEAHLEGRPVQFCQSADGAFA
ncbi:MAG TPA: galactokinase family protein [Candidatus Acidoferrales bacterium]|nr:galactokinase family protein [Candidatus Acidoferrales bacterium]